MDGPTLSASSETVNKSNTHISSLINYESR
jgi:hypothetical protein